jgi:hypothetical protein
MSPKNKRQKRKGSGGETDKSPQSAGFRYGFPHRHTRPLYNGRRPRPKVYGADADAGPSASRAPPEPEGGAVRAGLLRATSMSRNPRVRRIVRAKGLAALDLGGVRRARAVTIGALPARPPREERTRGGEGAGEKPESGALPPREKGGEEGRAGLNGAALAIEGSDSEYESAEDGSSSSSSTDAKDARSDDDRPRASAVDRTVESFLRSSSPSRYTPGPIRTQPAFGLYAVPVMTAFDVLGGGGGVAGARANAAAVRAAAKTDEAVMDELVGHFEGYGFGGEGAATLHQYWSAPPRSASAVSSSPSPPPQVPLHRLSGVGSSVGMPSPSSLSGRKRWSSGVSSAHSGVSGASGGTAGTGGSGAPGSGGSGAARSAPEMIGANAFLESQRDAAKLRTPGSALDGLPAAAGSRGRETGAKARGTLASATSGGRSRLAPHWLPRTSRTSRMTREANRVRRADTREDPSAGANEGATTTDGSASPTSRGSQERQKGGGGSKLSLRRWLALGGRSSR